MTAEPEPQPPGGSDVAAAEYVLGLLSEAEARDFEARMLRDSALQRDVAGWLGHFAALAGSVPERAPPASAWSGIEAQLGLRRSTLPGALWRQLLPYALGAVVAAGIAWAALTSGLLVTDGAGAELQAELVAEDHGLRLSAIYDGARGTILLSRDAGEYPAGAALELWVLPAPDGAPVSLGLIARDGVTSLPLGTGAGGDMLAVSLEPEGGSPTGAPSGPVIAMARLAAR